MCILYDVYSLSCLHYTFPNQWTLPDKSQQLRHYLYRENDLYSNFIFLEFDDELMHEPAIDMSKQTTREKSDWNRMAQDDIAKTLRYALLF